MQAQFAPFAQISRSRMFRSPFEHANFIYVPLRAISDFVLIISFNLGLHV